MSNFSKNLRHYREKAGYKSAKDFANTLGIQPNTYVGYEVRGREPKYETLCKIADLLEVSIDDLIRPKKPKFDTYILNLLNKENEK